MLTATSTLAENGFSQQLEIQPPFLNVYNHTYRARLLRRNKTQQMFTYETAHLR